MCRLLKGVFTSQPPRPKLCPTWSVQQVLETISAWSPASSLNLKHLLLKSCMLVALASAKRPNSLHLLSVRDGYHEVGASSVQFQPVDLEKTEGSHHSAQPLTLQGYTEDPRLCPMHYMKSYLKFTKDLRYSDRLFVTLRTPHGAAATSTISRWLEDVIAMSGHSGSGGSTRAVAPSQAISRGASLQSVLAARDWTKAATFHCCYFKPVPLSFQDNVFH